MQGQTQPNMTSAEANITETNHHQEISALKQTNTSLNIRSIIELNCNTITPQTKDKQTIRCIAVAGANTQPKTTADDAGAGACP